jgi:FkbH-like protein
MRWLPEPERFRERLAAAAAADNSVERCALLASLSNARLNYMETIHLDNVLRRTPSDPSGSLEPVRVALLAASTIDHLLPAIRVAGLRRGLKIELYATPFGQHVQELLAPQSALHAFQPQIAVFASAASDLLGAVPLSADAAFAEARVDAAVEAVRSQWSRAREAFGAAIIQQSCLQRDPPVFGDLDALVPGAPARLTARLNAHLADAARADGVAWLDVARAAARDGLAIWFDPVRWLQAKMEISPSAALTYGDLVARVVAALRGKSRKCLVLDLDNTLWGGVVGDDGVAGLVLGQGSGVGEAHLALQRYAAALRERGVLLAVCSKNDPSLAAAAFSEHPEMLLTMDDFAAFVANWEDKAANLSLIASQLNIGLDSLVFVDDNPVERARIRDALPMVATIELPEDPAFFVSVLAEAGYFEASAFTAEDRERTTLYQADACRDAARGAAGDLEAFLEQLEMRVEVGPVTPLNLARVTQLINKTNQFNTTTIRRTEAEIAALCQDPQVFHLQFRLIDKFGDNGIVSVLIAAPMEDDTEALRIENWVMSCRVFGRGLEREVMNIVVEQARRSGVLRLIGPFTPTAKNGVIATLFRDLGFSLVHEGGASNLWALDIKDYALLPTNIARVSADNV